MHLVDLSKLLTCYLQRAAMQILFFLNEPNTKFLMNDGDV
jgi:hypothetical protein